MSFEIGETVECPRSYGVPGDIRIERGIVKSLDIDGKNCVISFSDGRVEYHSLFELKKNVGGNSVSGA